MTSEIYETAIEAVVKGDAALATETAEKGLSEGIDPLGLLDKGFVPGINKVGDMFDVTDVSAHAVLAFLARIASRMRWLLAVCAMARSCLARV